MGPEWLHKRPGGPARRPDFYPPLHSPPKTNRQAHGQQDNRRSSEQSPRTPTAVMMPPKSAVKSQAEQVSCSANTKRHRSDSPSGQRQSKAARTDSVHSDESAPASTSSDQEQTWHTPPPPPEQTKAPGMTQGQAEKDFSHNLVSKIHHGLDARRAAADASYALVRERDKLGQFKDLQTDSLYLEVSNNLERRVVEYNKKTESHNAEALTIIYRMIDDRAASKLPQYTGLVDNAVRTMETSLATQKTELKAFITATRGETTVATMTACEAMQRSVDIKLAENNHEMQSILTKCERLMRSGEAEKQALQTGVAAAKEQIRRLDDSLQQSRAESSAARTDLAELKTQVQSLMSGATDFSEQLTEQKKLVSDAHSELAELKTQADVLASDNASLRECLDNTRQLVDDAHSELVKLKTEVGALTRESTALRAELAQEKEVSSEARSELAELKEELQKAQARIKKDRKVQDNRHSEVSAAQKSVLDFSKDAAIRNSQIETDLEALSKSFKQLNADFLGLSESSQQCASRSEVQHYVKAFEERFTTLTEMYVPRNTLDDRLAKIEEELNKTTGIANASTTAACLAQDIALKTEAGFKGIQPAQEWVTRTKLSEIVDSWKKAVAALRKDIMSLTAGHAILFDHINTRIAGALQVHWAVLQKATSAETISLALATVREVPPPPQLQVRPVVAATNRLVPITTQTMTPQTTPTQMSPPSGQLDPALPILQRRSVG